MNLRVSMFIGLFSLYYQRRNRPMPTGQREDLISVGGACDGDWWNVQQGEQTRQKHAMGCEISGRPSITVSNLWFNQSAMSSEARPACCAGVRLSHQPPAPKKQMQEYNGSCCLKVLKGWDHQRRNSNGITQGDAPLCLSATRRCRSLF